MKENGSGSSKIFQKTFPNYTSYKIEGDGAVIIVLNEPPPSGPTLEDLGRFVLAYCEHCPFSEYATNISVIGQPMLGIARCSGFKQNGTGSSAEFKIINKAVSQVVGELSLCGINP